MALPYSAVVSSICSLASETVGEHLDGVFARDPPPLAAQSPERSAAPVTVTVHLVDDVLPRADGRQWTTDQYQGRDAVLKALGVPTFGHWRHPW